MKKDMVELKKELTIFLMILIAFITRKNGNRLEQLEEWMFIEKRMKKVTFTKNYYILSQQFSTERFKEITREHWNIECSLHWKLDVILDEDHSTSKKDNSIDNLAIIRKIVFNLARLDTSMSNLTLKKKLTRYSFDFKNIENLIFKVIPSL